MIVKIDLALNAGTAAAMKKLVAAGGAEVVAVSRKEIDDSGLSPRPDCRGCRHSRELPGDAHIGCANHQATVIVDAHGHRHGWAHWPFRFDPIWIAGCDRLAPGDRTTEDTAGLPLPVVAEIRN